jgi:MoaD family protein
MEGSTVEELLKNLSLSHRRFESAIFDESGEVREHIIIMKNRKDVASIGGLQTALSEGDEVAILPPVSGG